MRKTIGRIPTLRCSFGLISTVFALTAIGFLMLYITQADTLGTRKMIVQAISFVLGAACAFVLYCIDVHLWLRLSNLLCVASFVALFAVLLFGVGEDQSGATSWLRLGFFGIQPSEPIKVLFCLVFAQKFSARKEAGQINAIKTVLALSLLCAIFVLLVVLQNDTGTALVFAFMFFVMYIAAGLSKAYIFAFAGLLAVLLPVGWFFLAPYQKDRILVFLRPETDPLGAGFQVMQSKIAIGSGGIFGKGVLQAPLSRLGMLPEHDTDFVFSVIGETFGFLGCVFVVALFFLLVLQVFLIAQRATDTASSLVCIGFAAMLMFHITENVGMCLGLLPVTGIPLPFLSYGGSSLMTNFIAIGLVLNIDKTTKNSYFSDRKDVLI